MKEDKVIEAQKFEAPQTVDFPIHAYLKVITSFFIYTKPVYLCNLLVRVGRNRPDGHVGEHQGAVLLHQRPLEEYA